MPFPDNTLERTLADLRAGTATPEDLLDALATNPLWVPLPAGVDSDGGTQLPITPIGGQAYVPAYTSAEQFTRAAAQQPHMQITGRQLAQLMPAHLGLAVNPGAQLGLPVQPDGVRRLRADQIVVPAGARLRLGQPAEEPHQLLAAISEQLRGIPGVFEARRALAQQDEEPAYLIIGIRGDDAVPGWQASAVQAVQTASQHVPGTLRIETTFLARNNDPLGTWFDAHTQPFYTAASPPCGAAGPMPRVHS